MLKFVFRKMLNKAWMILSLLIGNVLLISIAMSNPMYTRAVTQNLLTRTLTDAYAETATYPGIATMEGTLTKAKGDSSATQAYRAAEVDILALPARINTPALYEIAFHCVEDLSGTPFVNRSDEAATVKLTVAAMTGLTEHIDLVEGDIYSAEPDADGVYDVLIGKTAFIRKNLVLGECLRFQYIAAPDGNPLTVRIAGVFTSDDSVYWASPESDYATQIFIDPALFHSMFINFEAQEYSVSTLWTTLFDIETMRAEDVPETLRVLSALSDQYNLTFIKRFQTEFGTLLSGYRTEANRASATLKVLEVPVFALLIAFMFMVSRQILEMEKNEIAYLKSRGAGKRQVLMVYVLQSFLIAILSALLSLPASRAICRAIGSSSAFLEFESQAHLVVAYTKTAFLYALVAALVGILTMVLPAISYSRLTIVDSKRARHARNQSSPWQKFGLDFILLGISLYGLYAFNNQKALLAEQAQAGAALDPLIYIASSLFAVGASLFMVRLIPLVAQAVFVLFKDRMHPAFYVSFLQILRSRRSQTFMMAFLMLTIAIGILNADTASTVNAAQETQLKYDLGADVVIKEAWTRQAGTYVETDAARYGQIGGVTASCKVLRDDAAFVTAKQTQLSSVSLMGIDTKAFGETAYMPDGLLDEHFYTYLNAMSQSPGDCLLSQNFQDILGLDVGDAISVRSSDQANVTVTIAGFVPYFPTYNASAYVTREDGTRTRADKYLVVCNLNYLQSAWGLQPYEIWLNTPESADAVYDYANASGQRYWTFQDIYTKRSALRNSPSIQGTNGILTLSFIVGLALCAAGFLIFWILSIKSRSLQFGIYRAMGMSVAEIIGMLLNEQFWQSVLSIAAGALIGWLVSRLYIPLIQIAYSSADASLPLRVTRDVWDHARLFAINAVVLLSCVTILILIIRRLKMAQALKLGED